MGNYLGVLDTLYDSHLYDVSQKNEGYAAYTVEFLADGRKLDFAAWSSTMLLMPPAPSFKSSTVYDPSQILIIEHPIHIMPKPMTTLLNCHAVIQRSSNYSEAQIQELESLLYAWAYSPAMLQRSGYTQTDIRERDQKVSEFLAGFSRAVV